MARLAIDFLNDIIPSAERQDIINRVSTYDIYPHLDALVGLTAPQFTRQIHFPAGRYVCNTKVELKTAVRLTGEGSGTDGAEVSEIMFPAGVSGFQINRNDTIGATTEADPEQYGAKGAVIEGLALNGTSKLTGSADAITLRARGTIRDVRIKNFSRHGVYSNATAVSANPAIIGNANATKLHDMRISSCGGDGVHIDGKDTNIWAIFAVDSSLNTGWGFADHGFLGNTYVACHCASNALGAYLCDDPGAQHVYIGCYAESDNDSTINTPGLIIGGQMGTNNGNGQRYWGGKQTAFSMTEDVSGTEVIFRYGSDGRPLRMIIDGDHSQGVGYRFEPLRNTWRMVHAGTTGAYELTTDKAGASQVVTDEDGTPLVGGDILLTRARYEVSSLKFRRVDEAFDEVFTRLDAQFNALTGTAEAAVAADKGKIVTMNNASANVYTIPANATTAIDVNSIIDVMQIGAGTTTITAAAGVTLNGVSAGSAALDAQWGRARLVQQAVDVWYMFGDHAAVA